jgi:chaperone modulatory protein CbpM
MAQRLTLSSDGSVLEDLELTLEELCEACSVHTHFIHELVEEGVIDPVDTQTSPWSFKGHCLKRVRVVANLQRDLEINLAGAALALDLIQEIDALRAELERVGALSKRL